MALRLAQIALTLSAMGLYPEVARADHLSHRELEVRAASLYSVARFVDWPAAIESADHFVFCVWGSSDFGETLRTKLVDRSLGGKPIRVEEVASSDDAKGCALLFMSHLPRNVLRRLLRELRASGTLTACADPDFLELGGVLRLLHRNGRLRFEINLGAAARARLHFHARLLSLADHVVARPNAGDSS